MKELTLKQLYGYSIMNWEIYLMKLFKAEDERDCSFCRDWGRQDNVFDSNSCESCKLNPFICYKEGNKGYFSKINRTEIKLIEQVHTIIRALKSEYYKL